MSELLRLSQRLILRSTKHFRHIHLVLQKKLTRICVNNIYLYIKLSSHYMPNEKLGKKFITISGLFLERINANVSIFDLRNFGVYCDYKLKAKKKLYMNHI